MAALGEIDLTVRSSDQWFAVMDRMIKLAVSEIIESTSVAEYCVSRLVVFQHSNKRRGLSMRMGRDEWSWMDVMSEMIGFVARPTLDRFVGLRLDRAYSQAILSEFLNAVDGYEGMVSVAVNDPASMLTGIGEQLDAVHRSVGAKHGRWLLQAVASVRHLDGEVTRLRNRILQVFSEYIDRMAAYDAAHHPLRVSVADTRQNYYLAAIKAVNHFNQDRGSFKSYLDIWLKKARNTSSHVTGSAYNAPSGAKANHIAVSMDDVDDAVMAQPADPGRRLSDLVRLVDPDGYLADAMDMAPSTGNAVKGKQPHRRSEGNAEETA